MKKIIRKGSSDRYRRRLTLLCKIMTQRVLTLLSLNYRSLRFKLKMNLNLLKLMGAVLRKMKKLTKEL